MEPPFRSPVRSFSAKDRFRKRENMTDGVDEMKTRGRWEGTLRMGGYRTQEGIERERQQERRAGSTQGPCVDILDV